MMSGVPENIISTLNTLYTNIQINKLGLTEEQLKSITPNFEFALEQTDEEASGNVYAMMLLSLVLFYAIYFCAYQVSSSITTEKTSKIIEMSTNTVVSNTVAIFTLPSGQLFLQSFFVKPSYSDFALSK